MQELVTLLVAFLMLQLLSVTTPACTLVKPGVEVYTNTRGILVQVAHTVTIKRNEWLGVGLIHNQTMTVYMIKLYHKIGSDRRIFSTVLNATTVQIDNSTVFETKPLASTRKSIVNSDATFTMCRMEVNNVGSYDKMVYLRGVNQEYSYRSTLFERTTDAITVVASNIQDLSDLHYCQNSNTTNFAAFYVPALKKIYGVSLGLFVHMDVIRVVCLTGLILLRNSTIVKSRFRSAILCVVLDMLCSVLRIASIIAFYIYTRSKTADFITVITVFTSCYFIAMFSSLFAFICIAGFYAIQVLRYFLIRNLYQLIQRQSKVMNISNNKVIVFYRLILSRWGTVITVLVVFTSVVSYLLPQVLKGRSHFFEALGKGGLQSATVSGYFISSVCIPGVVIDVLINWKMIRSKGLLKGLVHYYASDPLYIRHEITILPVLLIPALAIAIAYTISPHFDMAIALVLIVTVLNPLLYYGGLPMIIELWRRTRVCCPDDVQVQKLVQKDMVESVLTDPHSFRMLKEYAASEFSIENIVLWEVLWKYKQRGGMKVKKAQKLYDLFLSTSSTMQVNVPGKTTKQYKQILERYEHLSSESEEQIPFDEFTSLYADTMKNINETFARFSVTKDYKAHLSALAAENDLLQTSYAVDENLLTSYRKLVDS